MLDLASGSNATEADDVVLKRNLMATDLPTGTVTFLFTDIEGSTQLWERYPEAMQAALARHDVILRSAVEANQRQRPLPSVCGRYSRR
jgi:class 3 adenylate cyclase